MDVLWDFPDYVSVKFNQAKQKNLQVRIKFRYQAVQPCSWIDLETEPEGGRLSSCSRVALTRQWRWNSGPAMRKSWPGCLPPSHPRSLCLLITQCQLLRRSRGWEYSWSKCGVPSTICHSAQATSERENSGAYNQTPCFIVFPKECVPTEYTCTFSFKDTNFYRFLILLFKSKFPLMHSQLHI